MSHLTKTKEELNLPGLVYNADEQVITVGPRSFPVNAELAYTSPWMLARYDDPNQLEESGVCINIHAKLIGTPKFHEWLGRVGTDVEFGRQVRADTIEVISSVFKVLEPTIELPESEDPGPFGFNMVITPNNHAELYTGGTCACLHPNPEGKWVKYRDWDEGYCEYDFHNTDADTQVWSLLAGLGHLSLLASQSS
ncbi:MAG: hypothetical protein JWO96_4 [Candidatus Saccharibacteria bacterium]|nr:hypothetical protein [Candidatus Saccharibacteria bacterium]